MNDPNEPMNILEHFGSLLTDQLSKASESFSEWLSLGNGVTQLISKTKDAVTELGEIDAMLTKISRTNPQLSKSDLNQIAERSFDTASRYGKKSTDYLAEVQKASIQGYSSPEKIAELSLLAQSSGGIDADLADSYLKASDAAYGYAGSIEKLNALLDSQSQTCSRNSVSLASLIQAAEKASGPLAAAGMEENEITALLGTGIVSSGEDGETVGNAVAGIVEGLGQITGAAKDPEEALQELARTYQSLSDGSARKNLILSDLGGEQGQNLLDGILSNWGLYEKMLADCADADGFAMNQAAASADNWEGSLNRLSNTWADTIGNLADSGAITSVINGLNGILTVVNKVTGTLGSAGSIGLGAGLFGIGSFAKNFARP